MHRAFQKFIDQLSESTDHNDLRRSMADLTAALNLSRFAYLALPQEPKARPQLISTYPPSWTTHYLERHYDAFDPVVRRVIRDVRPFRWGLGFGPKTWSTPEYELFEEAASFGIRFGFTIPIHDERGAIAAVTFATDNCRIGFERSVKAHTDVLQLIARYFHAHAKPRPSFDRVINGMRLSPREFECLEWSAQGKSAWEIGKLLGISRRTAAFHLDNVRAKLGVGTVRQAVALLAESKSRR